MGRPGETHVSHVPPGHEDAHERLQPPPGRPALAEPVIAVDAMGGDYAPDEIVAGALAAQREHGLTTLLTGPPARLRPVIARLGGGSELRVVPAEDVVGMGEGALAGFRRPRSSIAVACQLVRRGQASAVVSAGSTGAIVASARHRLLPLPGVPRPGLAVVLPTHPTPDGAHRRGRDRRPQAGDARPVRPAGRGVRADRARHRRPPGSGCSPSGRSPARETR